MLLLGNPEKSNLSLVYDDEIQVIGEDLYTLYIRPILEDYKILHFSNIEKSYEKLDECHMKKNEKKNKSKKNKLNKEDEIILKINKEKLQKKLVILLEIFKTKEKLISQNFNIEYENILEFKFIIFILMSKIIKKTYQDFPENSIEFVLGIESILKKITNSKENHFISHLTKKPTNVSIKCITDLQNELNSLKSLINYNPLELLCKFPRLLISNIITEKYYKLKYIVPFEHQIELINILKNSFSDYNSKIPETKIKPNLIFLKTSIGSGKTTIALAISSLIDWIRKKTNIPEYSLIFACSIDIVRQYVGRIAYNSEITFGIATSFYKNPKIINSWSCRNVKNVNLIISDYQTARLLLNKSKNYILFIDEPTNDADNNKSSLLNSFSRLFRNSPQNVILSSATLPSLELMEPFINFFKYSMYYNPVISNITSGFSFIGCQINDLFFTSYFPHHCCKNSIELLKVYQNTFDDSLLSRCYNSHNMLDLYYRMQKFFKIDELPNFKEFFSDVENLIYTKIIEKCKELLQILINKNDDDIIEEVCKCDSKFCDFYNKEKVGI